METTKKELEVLTLTEIKETLGAEGFKVVPSKEVDEFGKALRATVYHGKEKLGLVKKGITPEELLKNSEKVVAVRTITKAGVDLGWVFTIDESVVI